MSHKLKVQYWPIDDVKPYPNNPRNNDDAVEYVANSIREFGWQQPLVVDTDGTIIAGHTRLKAAKLLGMNTVPVVVADNLTPAQVNAYRLADNKVAEAATWDTEALAVELEGLEVDFDMTMFDFDATEFDFGGLGGEPTDIVEDEVPEDAPPIVQKGDVWQLGRHRLMCGDSTDSGAIEVLMDGKKADMAFTDPPYGVSYTGGLQFRDGYVEKNNRNMIKNDDSDLYEDVFRMLAMYVSGACYVWFAGTKARTLYEAAEKYGTIHALIIWVKNGGYGALNANYKQKHEPCLYWNPKGTTLGFCGNTTETTVWDIAKDGVNNYHPTQKPVALAAKAINNHSAGLVLDLFGGSGSTMIACEQLGRTCYMMELDPHYCDIIIERWQNLTGETAHKVEQDG